MAYTITMTQQLAWLANALTPSVGSIQCGTRQPQDGDYSLVGDFREYAGDRVQMVNQNVHTRSRPIVLVALTAAQLQQIVDWSGSVLCLRTADGDRIFGGYFQIADRVLYNVTMDNGATNVVYDVTLVFTRVSFAEAV